MSSRKGSTLSVSECNDFLFGDSPARSSTSDLVASLLGNIAMGSAVALISGTNPAIPVALSCIPIIVPMSVTQISASTSAMSFLSEDAKNFVKGITFVSMGQGTLAIVDLMFGDLLSGFMKGIFAGLGFYISTMEDGVNVLPSYTVVSFVNGCITLLSAFEQMSARRSPMFSGVMPLYLNYMHLSQLAHPLLCFAGAYMGWQIIKELRRTGVVQSATTAEPPRMPRTDTGHLLANSGLVTNQTAFTPFTGRGHSLSRQPSVSTSN